MTHLVGNFHTVPKNQNAFLEYNHTWTNNDWHEQSICRRLLEKKLSPQFLEQEEILREMT